MFVKFTLGDIRTAVRTKLGDTSYDTAIIDQAANDFQFELFNDNRIRFMEDSTVLEIGSGATSKVLPDDFMSVITLIVLDSASQFRDITKNGYWDYNTFMARFANYTVANAQSIHDWTLFGEGLRFAAPTDAAYNANLDYLRSPVLMTGATSECELPINSRELMTLGTLERVMRVDEDLDESDFELDRLQPLRTSFIRNYGRGSGNIGTPRVIKTGKSRHGTYRADRDF